MLLQQIRMRGGHVWRNSIQAILALPSTWMCLSCIALLHGQSEADVKYSNQQIRSQWSLLVCQNAQPAFSMCYLQPAQPLLALHRHRCHVAPQHNLTVCWKYHIGVHWGCFALQVVAACLRFCSVAEAFAANKLAARDALMHILGAFVKGSHKSNMQALKHCLAVETWGAGSSQGSTAEGSSSSTTCSDMDVTCLQQALSNNAYLVCSFGGDGFISDCAEWLESGNPFRKQCRAIGGKLASVLHLP